MKILTIVLGWGEKSERRRPEYYVQEDSLQTKRKSVLDGGTASFTLWSGVLANQEDSDLKVDGNGEENDLVDVWLY